MMEGIELINKEKNKTIPITMPRQLATWLENTSQREGISKSYIVIEALRRYRRSFNYYSNKEGKENN